MVLTHANVEPVDIVGQQAIEPGGGGALAANFFDEDVAATMNWPMCEMSKTPTCPPHCLMFLDDAGVLHRR